LVGTTTELLINRSLIFDILKAWYIDWLPVRNPQAKKEKKKEKELKSL